MSETICLPRRHLVGAESRSDSRSRHVPFPDYLVATAVNVKRRVKRDERRHSDPAAERDGRAVRAALRGAVENIAGGRVEDDNEWLNSGGRRCRRGESSRSDLVSPVWS